MGHLCQEANQTFHLTWNSKIKNTKICAKLKLHKTEKDAEQNLKR